MEKDFINFLKDRKIKITSERKVIINVLKKARVPLSPTDIFLLMKIHLPKVNLTTVYRNLEMLVNLGLIKRVFFYNGYFSYEIIANRDHHHHVICKNCGKIEDLEKISENFVGRVSEKTRFKIEDHNLEFFGICLYCQEEV